MKYVGLLACLALSACATPIDQHVRVPDWPELDVVEHHVANDEMRERCARYAGPLMTPVGCTLFYFDRSEAHIYVSKDFPSERVLEHERPHAVGYDHIGSAAMQRLWEDWKSRARGQ